MACVILSSSRDTTRVIVKMSKTVSDYHRHVIRSVITRLEGTSHPVGPDSTTKQYLIKKDETVVVDSFLNSGMNIGGFSVDVFEKTFLLYFEPR